MLPVRLLGLGGRIYSLELIEQFGWITSAGCLANDLTDRSRLSGALPGGNFRDVEILFTYIEAILIQRILEFVLNNDSS